jgi:predicted Zn-dependent protease with MMP-like domain
MPAEPLYAADIPPEKDPTLEDIHALALEALAAIPEPFKSQIEGVVVRVAEWPEGDVLDDLGIESRYGLLGLYHGVSLTERSSGEIAAPVNMIFLYRQPLLAAWEEEGCDLRNLVHNTLVHEFGHHFGHSDARMDAIETAPDEEDAKNRG